MDKKSPLVHKIKEWVDAQYDAGRVTVITNDELFEETEAAKKELGLVKPVRPAK